MTLPHIVRRERGGCLFEWEKDTPLFAEPSNALNAKPRRGQARVDGVGYGKMRCNAEYPNGILQSFIVSQSTPVIWL